MGKLMPPGSHARHLSSSASADFFRLAAATCVSSAANLAVLDCVKKPGSDPEIPEPFDLIVDHFFKIEVQPDNVAHPPSGMPIGLDDIGHFIERMTLRAFARCQDETEKPVWLFHVGHMIGAVLLMRPVLS